MVIAPYFCSGCGGHPCKCWRALERERVATTPVPRVAWECSHRAIESHPEKAHERLQGTKQWWFGHRSLWVKKAV